MPWVAEIKEKIALNNGDITIAVDYTSEERTFTETYSISSGNQLKQTIKSNLRRLENNDSALKNISVGELFTDVVDSQPINPERTKEQIDRETYNVLFQKYKTILELVGMGVIPAEDVIVKKTLSDLKEAYKPKFI